MVTSERNGRSNGTLRSKVLKNERKPLVEQRTCCLTDAQLRNLAAVADEVVVEKTIRMLVGRIVHEIISIESDVAAEAANIVAEGNRQQASDDEVRRLRENMERTEIGVLKWGAVKSYLGLLQTWTFFTFVCGVVLNSNAIFVLDAGIVASDTPRLALGIASLVVVSYVLFISLTHSSWSLQTASSHEWNRQRTAIQKRMLIAIVLFMLCFLSRPLAGNIYNLVGAVVGPIAAACFSALTLAMFVYLEASALKAVTLWAVGRRHQYREQVYEDNPVYSRLKAMLLVSCQENRRIRENIARSEKVLGRSEELINLFTAEALIEVREFRHRSIYGACRE